MIQPTGDRIVVRMDEPEPLSAGGLHLPTPDTQLTGTVIAIGSGLRCPSCGHGRALTLTIGDMVVLGPNIPVHEVTVDGEAYTIVKETDVLAVLPQENAS